MSSFALNVENKRIFGILDLFETSFEWFGGGVENSFGERDG